MIAPFRYVPLRQAIAWPIGLLHLTALHPAALRRRLPAPLRKKPPGTLLGAHHDIVPKSDDTPAIRARVDQSSVDHVVLRVSSGNRALNSPLGMRLLRLHAESRGVVVILETRSRSIRAFARHQGLTAVASIRTRELYDGRLRSRRAGVGALRLPVPVFALIGRIATAGVLTLAVITALVLLVPQTTVRIAPQLSATAITVPVQARLPQTNAALPDGLLPARRFSTIVAHFDRGRSSGIIETPDTTSRGEVRFSNRTGVLVSLPAGTIVTATATDAGPDGDIAFRTRTDAVLPAQRGATETVPIEAVAPGPAGNLPAGSVTRVEPGLATRVAVENITPFSGGTTRSARTPTLQDRELLRATGIASLRERGLEQLRALSVGAFVFHAGSVSVTIQEERFDPPPGGVGADLDIALQATVSVLGVDLVLLEQLAAQQISGPQGLAGFAGSADPGDPSRGSNAETADPTGSPAPITTAATIVPGSVAVRGTSDAQFDAATGTISFDMLVDAVVAPVITESQVKAAVQWKSSNDAEQALAQQLPLRAPAEIRITPGFMPRTALFGFRTKVEIDVVAESALPGPDTPPSLAILPSR